MYAWRAEIGLINPRHRRFHGADFHRFVPDGVGIITTRVPLSAACPARRA